MNAKQAYVSWGTNPQYLIENKINKDVEFFFSLAQDDGRLVRGSKTPFSKQIHPVCMIIYPCIDGKKVIKWDKSVAIKDWISTVTANRELSLRATLPKGKYLLVPSTQEPKTYGKYYLSVYYGAEFADITISNLTELESKGTEIKEEDEYVEVSRLRRTIVQARLVCLANEELWRDKWMIQRPTQNKESWIDKWMIQKPTPKEYSWVTIWLLRRESRKQQSWVAKWMIHCSVWKQESWVTEWLL
jgi:hypothetical protein